MPIRGQSFYGRAASRFRPFPGQRSQTGENTYFLRPRRAQVFVAPRTLVPPIRASTTRADGMRVIVISTSGDPKDKAGQRIAYLEKYAPEHPIADEDETAAHGKEAYFVANWRTAQRGFLDIDTNQRFRRELCSKDMASNTIDNPRRCLAVFGGCSRPFAPTKGPEPPGLRTRVPQDDRK